MRRIRYWVDDPDLSLGEALILIADEEAFERGGKQRATIIVDMSFNGGPFKSFKLTKEPNRTVIERV